MTTMREGPDLPDLGGTTTARTTTEREVVLAPPSPSSEPQPPVVLVGRLVSIRYVLSALRRRRKVWLSLAALGLLVGLGFHVVVPRSYSAYSTLYLAQPPGIDPAVGIANDMALLQTTAVGQRAVSLLGEHSLSPSSLLGKVPGVVESEDVLRLNIAGPTKDEAVRRAKAVATAFLDFRAERLQQQTAAADKALNKQIRLLQQQISQLSATISGLEGSSSRSEELTNLVSEQSSDTSNLTSLEQSVQQNQLSSIAVDSGSRIVTPGTLVPASTAKLFMLSGLSGLIGGLVIGVAYVAVQAVVTDRIRRRDELASLLGAPVELSLQPVRHSMWRPERWFKQSALEQRAQVAALSGYLRLRGVPQGERTTLLVVALDDLVVPAAALEVLAKRLSDEGESVLVVDLTSDRLLARGLSDLPVEDPSLADHPGGDLHVFTPSPDKMSEVTEPPWVAAQAEAHAVLALTTIDFAKGAWHLSWAKEAVVSATAGRSSAKRVSSTAVLLRAAGITIRSGVLIGADAEDESIGLLRPDTPLVGLPVVDGVIPS